ncbi:MAG: tetratricopeptide repeat protein, partial [Sphingomonadales bacterium]
MKQSVDQSLRKAASLSAKGDVDGAEAIYRSVLERFPTNKRALDGIRSLSAPSDMTAYENSLDAVLTLYNQGRLHEVLDHVRLLIDLYPSQSELHNIAGAAAAGTGQLDRAAAAYDGAIELNPGYAEAYSNRATALIGLQRYDDALASCD